MRVQSIWTAIEPGYPARNRFLGFAVKMALGKVHRIAEFNDMSQEVRAMAEALENAGHLLTAGVRAPFVVYLRNLAGGVSILNHFDLGLRVWHARRLAYLLPLYHQALVADLTGDSFPVKIFQQWNGVFSGEARHLFEAGYVHHLSAKLLYLGAQSGQGFLVDEESLASHTDKNFFSKE